VQLIFCKFSQSYLLWLMNSRLQVGIDFAGHSFIVAFCQKSGDETQAGSGIGEYGSDADAPFEFALDALRPLVVRSRMRRRALTFSGRES